MDMQRQSVASVGAKTGPETVTMVLEMIHKSLDACWEKVSYMEERLGPAKDPGCGNVAPMPNGIEPLLVQLGDKANVLCQKLVRIAERL